MGLTEDSSELIGQLLHVEPIYGWGWSRRGGDSTFVTDEELDAIQPFKIRLLSLFHFENKLRGGVGRVEEPGSQYHNYFVVFSTRNIGVYDLTEPIANYNVSIGSVAPSGDWPLFPQDSPGMSGFAKTRYTEA